MKILPVEALFFHADERADMAKLIIGFAALQEHLKWMLF
jgi:hypothetical protein